LQRLNASCGAGKEDVVVIDEKGNSRLEIDPMAALEYVMEHFAPAVPGAWASDCIWTVGDALRKAEARVKELIKLANAVTVSEFCGITCNDLWIDGKRINWFDARAALAGKGE